VEYVLTGRDMIGQLVDNAAVDANNQIRHTAQMTLAEITRFLIRGTRIPPQFRMQGIPHGPLLFQTQPGETKINALQRYLEFCNCLVWAAPNGQVVIGKPDFTNKLGGVLKVSRSDPSGNNVIEARVRRGLNGAIRQIVTQLQSLGSVAPAPYTVLNSDRDMSRLAASQVGRSVYRTFSYGGATDIVNVIQKVGNSGSPFDIGRALSLREIARENVRVLDVELVLRGHVNPDGEPFDIDQVYDVQIEDDDVAEPMYVYGCNYSLTPDTGMLTTLRLCRLGAIVAYGEQIRRTNNNAR
jgi:prophage tail gpP-like protein